MTEEVTTQTQNIPDKQEELKSILFLLRKLNQLMEKQETKLKNIEGECQQIGTSSPKKRKLEKTDNEDSYLSDSSEKTMQIDEPENKVNRKYMFNTNFKQDTESKAIQYIKVNDGFRTIYKKIKFKKDLDKVLEYLFDMSEYKFVLSKGDYLKVEVRIPKDTYDIYEII